MTALEFLKRGLELAAGDWQQVIDRDKHRIADRAGLIEIGDDPRLIASGGKSALPIPLSVADK